MSSTKPRIEFHGRKSSADLLAPGVSTGADHGAIISFAGYTASIV